MSARCDQTDLLVDQCAHCRGDKSTDEQVVAERKRLLATDPRWFEAQYPGTCNRCGEPFWPGTAIRLVTDHHLGLNESHWMAECCTGGVS